MIYQDFHGLKISALGLGAMRLPTTGGDWNAAINETETAQMVDYALANGVNYFDTAWGYHGGQSEVVIGKALRRYPRAGWYLADKFPGYDLANMGKAAAIFEEQLVRCGVDYFDFYLFHNVCEMNIAAYLDEQYDTYEVLCREKQRGRIRHLGFSAHGSIAVMRRFLERYGREMEFCQLQLNYIDWNFQDAKGKVALLNEYHIPVWVMEPMRGGTLAALAEDHTAILKGLRPHESIPAWAFRFIQTLPEVVVSLTGSSSLAQLRDNINTYQAAQPLQDAEMDALMNIAAQMVQAIALPCTSCRYCTGQCPQELDIPRILNLYNEYCFTGGGFLAPMVVNTLPEDKRPKACVACRRCEAVCPQQIKIAAAMADFTAKLK